MRDWKKTSKPTGEGKMKLSTEPRWENFWRFFDIMVAEPFFEKLASRRVKWCVCTTNFWDFGVDIFEIKLKLKKWRQKRLCIEGVLWLSRLCRRHYGS